MAHPYEPQEPRETPKQAETKTAEPDQFPVSATGSVEFVESQSSDNREAADAKRADDDLEAQQDMAVAAAVHAVIGFLTLIGLVFTVVYARKAWKEAGRNADAAVKTAEHAKQGVVAADRAAKAAEDAVKVTSDTAKRQLRAYVSAIPHGVIYAAPHNLVFVQFRTENRGQTPAYEVDNVGNVALLPYPLPANFSFPALAETGRSKSTIHPGERFPAYAQFGSDPIARNDLLSAFLGAPRRLYVYGIVSYVDVFGDRHETQFCGSYIPDDRVAAAFGQTIDQEVNVGNISCETSDQHNKCT